MEHPLNFITCILIYLYDRSTLRQSKTWETEISGAGVSCISNSSHLYSVTSWSYRRGKLKDNKPNRYAVSSCVLTFDFASHSKQPKSSQVLSNLPQKTLRFVTLHFVPLMLLNPSCCVKRYAYQLSDKKMNVKDWKWCPLCVICMQNFHFWNLHELQRIGNQF